MNCYGLVSAEVDKKPHGLLFALILLNFQNYVKSRY